MAQNVTIAGNQYPSVPSVLIPKTGGGGNAIFADPSPVTASAADVLAGKYFLDSTGSITEGTGSGGGDDSANEIIERTISGIYTNSTVSVVGVYAFYKCQSLKDVSFTSATSIYNNAFENCTSLATASFPAVTSIGGSAFYSCTFLATVSFPVATTIAGYAFNGCTKLTIASFPVVTSIGNYAFTGCTKLTIASFPAATLISNYAFSSCRSLATVSFPAATTIGGSAFLNCRKLESAYFLGSSVPTLGTNAFNSTPMSASSWIGHWGSIFVKESLLASFQAATNWSTWKNRMVGLTDAQIAALS